jgi:hypothetical protein
VIVNGDAALVPPPGAGENTLTCAVPAVARSLPGIEACSSVLLTKVVARSAPFHRTTDAAANPPPETERVNGPEPVNAVEGDSAVMTGAGFRLASTVTGTLVAARM